MVLLVYCLSSVISYWDPSKYWCLELAPHHFQCDRTFRGNAKLRLFEPLCAHKISIQCMQTIFTPMVNELWRCATLVKNLLAELYNSRLVPTNCTNGQMKRFSLPFPIPPDNLEGRGGWTSQYLPRFDGARIQCAHCPMCTMCTGLASVKVSPKERDNLVQFNFVRKCLLILHGGRR